MIYQEIGQSYLDNYKISLCPKETCTCWSRPHAHPKDRKICKMGLPKGRKSLFEFLHEVGHIVHPRGGIKKELRSVEEFYATQYAIVEMKKNNIAVAKDQQQSYNRYITRCIARALRRGLKKVPVEVRHLKPKYW